MIRLTFIVPKFVLPSLEYACKIKQSNKLILNNCKNCPMQESRFAGFTKLTTVKFKQPEWISWYILSTVIWIKIVEFSSISSVWFHEWESVKVWDHEIVSRPLIINRHCLIVKNVRRRRRGSRHHYPKNSVQMALLYSWQMILRSEILLL